MKEINVKGYFWRGPGAMLLASVFFALMGVFVKLGSSRLPGAELAFVRFVFGAWAVWVMSKAGLADLSSINKKGLVLRGVLGGSAVLLFYAAIASGTLTNATVLNSAYPIFAAIFATFVLKERFGLFTLLPMVASMIGMALLTHPDFGHLKAGDLFALGSAVLAGGAIVTIRELRKTETAWAIFFYFSVMGAVFSGLWMLWNFAIPTLKEVFFMLVAAVLATIGQLVMTGAYKYCSASVGSVLTMTSAVFSAFLAVILFGEMLTAGEWVGAFLVILGSTLLVLVKPSDGEIQNQAVEKVQSGKEG